MKKAKGEAQGERLRPLVTGSWLQANDSWLLVRWFDRYFWGKRKTQQEIKSAGETYCN